MPACPGTGTLKRVVTLMRTAGESADSFCERCVKEAGVLLLPGSQFGHASSDAFDSSFRIGYGRHDVLQCLEKLGSWLDG